MPLTISAPDGLTLANLASCPLCGLLVLRAEVTPGLEFVWNPTADARELVRSLLGAAAARAQGFARPEGEPHDCSSRRCRHCGCTDGTLGFDLATGMPVLWAGLDLCTACAGGWANG